MTCLVHTRSLLHCVRAGQSVSIWSVRCLAHSFVKSKTIGSMKMKYGWQRVAAGRRRVASARRVQREFAPCVRGLHGLLLTTICLSCGYLWSSIYSSAQGPAGELSSSTWQASFSYFPTNSFIHYCWGNVKMSRGFAWFVSTYFARILYSGCQHQKFNPLVQLHPSFLLLSLSLRPSLRRQLAGWRTVWLSDVSLRFHPRLIDVSQQKSWHLLYCCRLQSEFWKSFAVFLAVLAAKNTTRNKSSRAAQTSSQT